MDVHTCTSQEGFFQHDPQNFHAEPTLSRLQFSPLSPSLILKFQVDNHGNSENMYVMNK